MGTRNNVFHRRQFTNPKIPSIKWFKQWVPHDVATGGKCFVLKWVNEAELNALKDKSKERELVESAELEPTTEVLFLCSHVGCGKTFIDAGALRKHFQIHWEKLHVCHYPNCGKKFPDSSKLKRHSLIHTGERDFLCPYDGCGKVFSPESNLKSHMKTHSQENYHICLYPECGKNHAHEYALKSCITSHPDKSHAQNAVVGKPRYTVVGKPVQAPTRLSAVECPYTWCKKTYTHPYRLYAHLKGMHPGHFPEEIAEIAQPCNNNYYYTENVMAEGSDQKWHAGNSNVQSMNNNNYYYTGNLMAEGSDQKLHAGNSNIQRLNRPMPNLQLPPYNALQQAVASLSNLSSMVNKPWPVKDEMHRYGEGNEERMMKGMMWEWDGSWKFG